MRDRQFGDFQTPPELVREIIESLRRRGIAWARALEPTCGRGNFIAGLMQSSPPPREIIGIEIQDAYWREACSLANSAGGRVRILHESVFKISLRTDLDWNSQGRLLVIGNPPWVTNAEIGSLNGNNLPKKSNFKGMRGIEALTGRSNFDLAEFILLKIIAEFEGDNALIAFLCKTSVARNVLVHAQRAGLGISDCEIRMIDAKKWFSASADACLFIAELGTPFPSYQAALYSSLQAAHPERIIAVVDGKLIADMEEYQLTAMLDGAFPIEWRQGIKHDAAPVLELSHANKEWRNGLGETVDVEDYFIYPLLKGSDIGGAGGPSQRERGVILTQRGLGEDTHDLKCSAPRLWAYLTRHSPVFARRRSSIYRGKPPFSIFGVGPYSFSDYKVLVSGLHKEPRFVAVGRHHGKPVLCDDTCYLLPCESGLQCALISALLNHSLTRQFLKSICFQDSKRPITKAILSRIDISALASLLSWEDIHDEVERTLYGMGEAAGFDPYLLSDLTSALSLPKSSDQKLLFTR